MTDLNTLVDRVEAADRLLFLECLLFVQEQSCGEWGEDVEREDAAKMAQFVRGQINQALRARGEQGHAD